MSTYGNRYPGSGSVPAWGTATPRGSRPEQKRVRTPKELAEQKARREQHKRERESLRRKRHQQMLKRLGGESIRSKVPAGVTIIRS